MAEALLKSIRPEWQVFSAGTAPAPIVHPMAVKVVEELGLNMTDAEPHDVDEYIDEQFDYVITVCDHAREMCPTFTGDVKYQRHMGYYDPSEKLGTREQRLAEFRRIRDEIKVGFSAFADEVGG